MEGAEQEAAAEFIAYVYPGWHRSAYRPSVDEWELLYSFQPYFEGHQPLPRPLQPYDDSKPETALMQIGLAQEYGVDGFTYFLYYEPEQFVMAKPIDAALAVVDEVSGFGISLTWCIRLPHSRFPIRLTDRSLPTEGHASNRTRTGDARETMLPPEQVPLEALTLAELEYLIKKYMHDDLPFNPMIDI